MFGCWSICCQSQTGAEGQGATYRLGQSVRAVVLDVSVTDRRGHPVAGLELDDFVVQENGVPQELNYFQSLEDHALPERANELAGQDLLTKSGDAPLTILLLDELSTEPEDLYFSRNQVAKYLKKQPTRLATPTTLLALRGKNLRRLEDFTTDRDLLRNRAAGFKSTNLNTAPERLGIYLGTLKELAAQMEPYHTRQNLVWMGPGLPALNQTVALNDLQQHALKHSMDGVVSDLVRSRMTQYTIDPQRLIPNATQIAKVDAVGVALCRAEATPRRVNWRFSSLLGRREARFSRCETMWQWGSAAAFAMDLPTTPCRTTRRIRVLAASFGVSKLL